MATGNTNDRKREETSRPSAGFSRERHKGKGELSAANCGYVEHPEKSDGKNRTEPLSKPGAGGHVHEEKRDGKNREEALSNPQGAGGPVAKDRQHLDKKAFEDARKHEPKPAGKTTSTGNPFKSTKRK